MRKIVCLRLLLVVAAVVMVTLVTTSSNVQAAQVIDPTACGGGGNPNCLNLPADVTIGANSCTALGACDDLGNGTEIGTNSCDTADGCDNLNGSVGNGSCLGTRACTNAGANGGQAVIGNGSCNSQGLFDAACENAGNNSGSFEVGDGSCLLDSSCEYAGNDGGYALIGDGSCISNVGSNPDDACRRAGEGPSSSATVGDGSCHGTDACQYAGYEGGLSVIGDDSCIGYNEVCYRSGQGGEGRIGDRSCLTTGTDEDACYYNGQYGYSAIGDDSCAGSEACYQNGFDDVPADPGIGNGVIGNGSCNGPSACYQNGFEAALGSIGNYSCNNDDAPASPCYANTATIGNCEYNDVTPTQCLVGACGNDFFDVPDSGPYFDFTEACQNHDSCYGDGGKELDRYRCDRAFLYDMRDSCDGQSRWAVRSCLSTAYTYYLGVRAGGWAFFPYS